MKNLLDAVGNVVKSVKVELETQLRSLREQIKRIEDELVELNQREKGITLPFDPERKWVRGQKVSCHGSEWQCLAGETKSEPAMNNPDWVLLRRGLSGVEASYDMGSIRFSVHIAGDSQHLEVPLHLPVHEGSWSAEKEYQLNQEVCHRGSGWRCVVDQTKQQPGEGDHWRLTAQRGKPGRHAKEINVVEVLEKSELQVQMLRSQLIDELSERFTAVDSEIEGLKDAIDHA